MNLTGREIVLGVTGSIAAYKSAEIVSRLRHLGAVVHVVMTENATKLITPLTFQTLSANPVVVDILPLLSVGKLSILPLQKERRYL